MVDSIRKRRRRHAQHQKPIAMSNEIQKSIELILNGTKSPQGVAIKMLAKMVDEKTTSLAEEAERRHEELLEAIEKISQENERKFKKLEVVSFLSSYPKIFWVIAIAMIALAGSGVENMYKTFIK